MSLLKIILKWTALLIVLLVTLGALAAAVISYQGRARLAEVKADLIAKGEKLTLSELLPVPVPDHLNFFEDPIWRPLPASDTPETNSLKQTPLAMADTPLTDAEMALGKCLFQPEFISHNPAMPRLDVARYVLSDQEAHPLTHAQALWILEALKNFHPIIDRINGLLDRPYARFRQSNDFLNNEVYEIGGGIFYAAKVLKPRASAHIALGDSESAFADIQTICRMIATTSTEPLLFMEMLRLALAAYIDQLLREGIVKSLWSDEQLMKMEAILQQMDFVGGIANAFRAERGLQNQYLEELFLGKRRVDPKNLVGRFVGRAFGMEQWIIYLHVFGPADQATLNRDIQLLIEFLDNSKNSGIDEQVIRSHMKPNDTGILRDHFFWSLGGNVPVAIELQTSLDQARIACALERYRLRHGTYPETLSPLVPEFLSSLPVDRYSLEPMKYKLVGNQHFELTARSGEEAIRWSNASP